MYGVGDNFLIGRVLPLGGWWLGLAVLWSDVRAHKGAAAGAKAGCGPAAELTTAPTQASKALRC